MDDVTATDFTDLGRPAQDLQAQGEHIIIVEMIPLYSKSFQLMSLLPAIAARGKLATRKCAWVHSREAGNEPVGTLTGKWVTSYLSYECTGS